MAKTWIDENLASVVRPPLVVLCNLGVNDCWFGLLPAEATWKANYKYIIDAMLAKWPTITVYLAKPWMRDYTAECNTIAGWIDDIIADYSGEVLLGHDERVWLEGGDDGVTMTLEGIHYNAAGNAECTAQWVAILTA